MPEIGNREWQKTGSVSAMNRKSGIGNRKMVQDRNTKRVTRNAKKSLLGFTSVELIMVIVCLAILTATIVVKNPFRSQDYAVIAADQLIADIQYVQMRAMGVGNSQGIQFAYMSNLSAYRILDNANNAIENKNLPDGVTVNSNNFNNTLRFNSLGEPFFGSNSSCFFAVGGNCIVTLRDNVTIMVYAVTGKTCRYDIANSRCF